MDDAARSKKNWLWPGASNFGQSFVFIAKSASAVNNER
jgi:hypothetical protein